MLKQVVIFIAPPGAGKGTQANLLAERFGLVHVETSKLGEAKIKDPELVKKDPIVAEAKRLYEKGGLFPPPWTTKLVIESIRELASDGKGAIFSGSPRTLYEAERELPELEKLYGRDNIKIFYIALSEEESVKRNSERRICEKNHHPIPRPEYDPKFKDIRICPWDGSPIVTRPALDKPEVIRERYKVFLRDTVPVLDYLREKGYDIIEINGERPIEKVFEDIVRHFKA
jgi:adenylate kinase